MEEGTTVCSNCQRPIASSNYVMHSLHCHRNLEKCRICGDAVPRSEMGAHAEHHAEESCSVCGVKVPRDRHDAHKANECKLRKISCAFCTLEVPSNELQEHEDYCGSRTELCADCGKFVMLKYQQLHLDSNHGFLKLDDDPVPSPRPKLGDFMVKKPPNQSRLYSGLPSNDWSSLDRLVALHLGEDSMMAGPNQSPAPSSSNSYSYPMGEDSVAIPCEFCQAVMPSDKLMEHQTGCNPDVTSFPSRDTTSKVKKTSVNSALKNGYSADGKSGAKASSSPPVFTIDDSDDDCIIMNVDETEAELPCEFCDSTYPASLLNQHQEICESRLASSTSPIHHWSMPTPGARTVTPPLTRKRIKAEAKFNESSSSTSSDVTSKTVQSNVPPVTGCYEASKTANSELANTSSGAVPKKSKSRKKRRAPAPPTPT